MSIIPCARDCIHQRDGYCCLETTAQVTNTSGGCAHYEHKGPAQAERAPGGPPNAVG